MFQDQLNVSRLDYNKLADALYGISKDRSMPREFIAMVTIDDISRIPLDRTSDFIAQAYELLSNTSERQKGAVVKALSIIQAIQNANQYNQIASADNISKPNLYLVGAHLPAADLRNRELGYSDFTNSVCIQTQFTRSHLMRVRFQGADLREANFHKAYLVMASFNLANMIFADLSKADCGSAEFVSAQMTRANLSNAHFGLANLSSARLVMANLEEARFGMANLKAAVLRRAIFRNTSFRLADLSFADLTDTDLSQADFTGAKLDHAKFMGDEIFQNIHVLKNKLDELFNMIESHQNKDLLKHAIVQSINDHLSCMVPSELKDQLVSVIYNHKLIAGHNAAPVRLFNSVSSRVRGLNDYVIQTPEQKDISRHLHN